MPVSASTPLGELLRRARKARGLTLEELAALAGVSRSYLHRLEAGAAARPSLGVLEGVSRALGVDYAALARVAGHHLPAPPSVDPWRQAVIERLLADDPTEDELQELIRFLRFIRERPAPSGALTDEQCAVADVLAEGVMSAGDIATLTGMAPTDVEKTLAGLRSLTGTTSITKIVPILRKRRLWPTAQRRRPSIAAEGEEAPNRPASVEALTQPSQVVHG